MGTVHLTGSHHNLFIRDPNTNIDQRLKLQPDWLDRPIVHGNLGQVDEAMQLLIQAALRALLSLPFDSAVSFGVCMMPGSCHISIPKRVWGEITLEDPRNVIVRFSHDSREVNRPYTNIIDWLEDEWSPDFTLREVREFSKKWSDYMWWEAFFTSRLMQAEKQLWDKVGQLIKESSEVSLQASKISSLLE